MPSKVSSSNTSSSQNLLPNSAAWQADVQPLEKSVLFDTLNAIASIRERKELFGAIFEQIKPAIPVDDTGILVLDKTGTRWQDWINTDNYQSHHTATQLQQNGYIGFQPVDQFTEYTLNHTGIMTVARFREQYPEHPFGAVMWEAGLREMMFTPLVNGGKKLGVLFFDSQKEGTYTQTHLSLFMAMADLIAVAVANILAREQILEREREKAVLLDISESIATVRDRKELFTLIVDKVQPLFGFNEHSNIAIYQPASHTLQMFFTKMNVSQQGQSSIPKFMVPFPVMGLFTQILQSRDVHIVEEDWKTRPKDNPLDEHSAQIWRDLDFKYCLSTALRSFDQVIGTFHVHFYEHKHFTPSQLDLFRAVSDQLSVAVANILANEEILEREQEKALLLSLSEDMATIRERNDLWRVMMEKIKPLVGFEDAVVICFSRDNTRSNTLLTLSKHDRTQENWYQYIKDNWIEIDASLQSIYSLGTAYWSTEAQLQEWPQFEGLLFMQRQQLRHTYQVQLRHGGKGIGLLLLHFKQKEHVQESKHNLYKAIADQVAVAVANILASEEILDRERKNQMLLDICNAAATIKDKKQLLRIIFEKVKPIYDIADVGLYLIDEDKDLCLDWSTAYPDITASPLGYRLSKLNLSKMPYKGSIIEWAVKVAEAAAKPVVFELTPALRNQWPGFLQLAAQIDEGYKECLFSTLRAGGKMIGTLDFHSRQHNYFSRCDHSLFQAIADQVAMALANMLASEELVSKAHEIERLNQELLQQNSYLIEEVKTHYNFEEIVGNSPALEDVFNSITLVAPSDASVLISGETGTGKELIARAIHNASHRKHKPLIKVNCAALPAQLIESELFGHEKGAFTGAIDRRIGKFEVAAGSTLFLDEIGEMPLELQAKLLRVLQEKEIERLGSNKVIKTDVRIIAATNRNLLKEVAEGRFRQDLYYRLSVFPVHLPSLRERREDIPVLATHFVGKMNKKLGKALQGVSNKVLQELLAYAWPGNIRELEHVIERSAILCREKVIREVQLPGQIGVNHRESPPSAHLKTLAEIEKAHIVAVLQQCNGRVRGPGGAAELLDIHPNTLDFRIKKLGIRKQVLVK